VGQTFGSGRLRVEREVIEVRPSKSRPEQGLIKLRTTTLNQDRFYSMAERNRSRRKDAASGKVPRPNAMAAICAETSQSRFARPKSRRSGLPRDRWQFAQYSPVMPATRGLAANRAGVAARRACD
jgi:hypothetical protein